MAVRISVDESIEVLSGSPLEQEVGDFFESESEGEMAMSEDDDDLEVVEQLLTTAYTTSTSRILDPVDRDSLLLLDKDLCSDSDDDENGKGNIVAIYIVIV